MLPISDRAWFAHNTPSAHWQSRAAMRIRWPIQTNLRLAEMLQHITTGKVVLAGTLNRTRYGDKGTELLGGPIAACAVFLIVGFWKSPSIFRHPRFWAEEGTVFYADFLHRSFLDSIFYIEHGSMQILSNLIVYLAVQVPVAFAPTVTTYFALVLHLFVVVQIVLFTRVHRLAKSVALLLVAAWALLPSTYEVWLNSVNAQWIAGVSALLLFAMPSEWIERHWKGVAGCCLVYALSGVPAVLLAPVFLLRAGVERSRPIGMLAVILAAGAVLQLAVIVWVGDPRPLTVDPVVLILPLFLQSVLAPVLSGDVAEKIAGWIVRPNPAKSAIAIGATLVIGLGVMGVTTVAASSSGRKPHALLLLLAWILVTEVQSFASVYPPENIAGWLSGRYFLCGSVSLCLLLAWGTMARQVSLRVASIGLLSMIVLTGAAEAKLSEWAKSMTNGPSWRRQIDACQTGEICRITVWGKGGPWVVELMK